MKLDGPDLFDMVIGTPFAMVQPSEISDTMRKDEVAVEKEERNERRRRWVGSLMACSRLDRVIGRSSTASILHIILDCVQRYRSFHPKQSVALVFVPMMSY